MSEARFAYQSTPATPATGKGLVYFKNDHLPYSKGADGVERPLAGGAGSVDSCALDASVAGPGLTGGACSPLAVNPDNLTIEVASDQVRIASGAAGNGLSGGGGTALNVNVDGTTIEINGSDQLRVVPNGFLTAPYRQGGDPADWGVTGTNNYQTGRIKMYFGRILWTGAAASSGSILVTFPETGFTSQGAQVWVQASELDIACDASLINLTNFAINWLSNSATNYTFMTLNWWAIGPVA